MRICRGKGGSQPGQKGPSGGEVTLPACAANIREHSARGHVLLPTRTRGTASDWGEDKIGAAGGKWRVVRRVYRRVAASFRYIPLPIVAVPLHTVTYRRRNGMARLQERRRISPLHTVTYRRRNSMARLQERRCIFPIDRDEETAKGEAGAPCELLHLSGVVTSRAAITRWHRSSGSNHRTSIRIHHRASDRSQ